MTSIFREIKRRKMARTCILYLFICWGLLQVGDILSPALGLEQNNFPRLFLYIAIGGLPLIIAFSWFYQLTRDGIVKTSSFHERRVLSNIPPIDDRRPGQSRKSAQKSHVEEYDWVITAETGPLSGLSYGISGTLLLGRSMDCDLAILSPQMSRRHARLELAGDTLTVEDLGSANGTMVNGKRISKKETLYPGDTLQFQEVEFRVSETYNRTKSGPSSVTQSTVFRPPSG